MIRGTPSDISKYMLGPDGRTPLMAGYITEPQIQKHYHSGIYEFFLVASGRLELTVDEVHIPLSKGDAICIEPGEVHEITCFTQDVAYFVIKYPPKQEDKVLA